MAVITTNQLFQKEHMMISFWCHIYHCCILLLGGNYSYANEAAIVEERMEFCKAISRCGQKDDCLHVGELLQHATP